MDSEKNTAYNTDFASGGMLTENFNLAVSRPNAKPRTVSWHFKRPTTMTKQLTILTFIFTICLTSCGQTTTDSKNQENHLDINKIDTSRIAILPFDTTEQGLFKDSKPTDLTSDDLQKIEAILSKCINDYNPEQEKQFENINKKHPEYKLNKKNFIIDLTRYNKQYVATINAKGEKEVWINCFCRTWDSNWKKELIIVEDGGNCYFNLKINLTTGQYYDLMVNGDP